MRITLSCKEKLIRILHFAERKRGKFFILHFMT